MLCKSCIGLTSQPKLVSREALFPRRGNFSCRLALGLMSTTKYHAAKISPSGGDVAAGDRRGAFPMWRPCRGSPSRAKLVPGLHIKGLSNKSPDRCRRRGFTVLPPTGGHNLRPGGPSTFPFITLLYNLRRSRAPLRLKALPSSFSPLTSLSNACILLSN